ncbi:MAG: sigma-E factor negative regulatory protein [Gammaproteobacteria bacterium]|nr:MAG: sigma-E factor negative regulatory protein [Gammaproteobacteria bacterium]
MKDKLHEQLSALVDDELSEAEQALLMKRLGTDSYLHRRLARYQLISDSLRNQLPDQIDPGFSARVQAAVLNEPTDARSSIPASKRLAALLKPVTGLAVAASVAVVAVLSLQSVREDAAPLPPVASTPSSADFIRADSTPEPATPPRADTTLDIYLVNHNEYAVNRGMQGVLPYVRILSNEISSGSKE